MAFPYAQVASDSAPVGHSRIKFLQAITGRGLTPTAGTSAVHPGFKAGDYAFVPTATANRLVAAGQAVVEAWAVPTIPQIDDF